LKRREVRDLTVVTGLDRQDEDHARHSRDSLTEDGLRQWLVENPSLPLVDITAGLLDHASTAPLDRLALAAPDRPVAEAAPYAEHAAIDAAALPKPARPDGWIGRQVDGADRSPDTMPVSGSEIRIIGERSEAKGVFVAPHFVLTPSGVIGERGLIDIEDAPGHRALGLVAAVDHGLGLALVQSPLTGRPVAIGAAGYVSASAPSGKGDGEPLLAGDRLVGFAMANGPAIGSDAIRMFLDRQRHLLPLPPQAAVSRR
jgi:hypothetical protein